ncbi:MAG: hypothetical protein J6R59_10350 [Paludibacteraceae bacterium]|nr:hypothetical protein [Paludibacteraceae bacterium]
MKAFFVFLCVICIIIPLIVYGVAIVKSIQMDADCISYFEMAADANSVELAEKHLTSGIEYLETNNLTKGNTKILVYKPTKDISLWYDNLKSAQTQLQELNAKEELTELEESNALMKLRETLLDSEGSVTHPPMISFYPTHCFWFWAMMLIWLMWIGAFVFGVIAYEEY